MPARPRRGGVRDSQGSGRYAPSLVETAMNEEQLRDYPNDEGAHAWQTEGEL
jgi:hypothetical protein